MGPFSVLSSWIHSNLVPKVCLCYQKLAFRTNRILVYAVLLYGRERCYNFKNKIKENRFYFIIFFTLNHKPPSGDRTNLRFEKTNGIIDLVQGVNSKFWINDTRPMRVCIIPKWSPMQFLGPWPNGKNDCGCRFWISSGLNLSGSKTSGFG